MSSSAPKLQPAPASQPAPFCYAEAQLGEQSAAKAEQANEDYMRRRESEAYERGRQETQQQLRASVDAAIAGGREQTSHVLGEFARERAAYYRRIEGEVVQLALAIARKILHREAQLDPHLLMGIVRVTLEKLNSATRIDLYVHPPETTDWCHYFAGQMEGAVLTEVHEDAALPAGECRIETSLGTTELGIESELKEIETGLLDLLAERPAADVAPPAIGGSGRPSSAPPQTHR